MSEVPNNINNYRQPMVTATGILLGFMLNFASSWVPKAFSTHVFIEIIIGLCLLICVPLLLIVLFRILSMRFPRDHAEAYYTRTLQLLIIGVALPFITLLIIMFRNLLSIH